MFADAANLILDSNLGRLRITTSPDIDLGRIGETRLGGMVVQVVDKAGMHAPDDALYSRRQSYLYCTRG